MDTVDLLQIKIEKAKENLPTDTLNAIAAVDWRETIRAMQARRKFNLEQLGDLELETELVLCGLTDPADYPKELEERMGISKSAANELVEEMNELVFKKIREELIKNTERKKIFQKRMEEKETETPVPPKSPLLPVIDKKDATVLGSAGIEVIPSPAPQAPVPEKPLEQREDILKKVENPEGEKVVPSAGTGTVHPLLGQKLAGTVQIPAVKTEHSLENTNKAGVSAPVKDKVLKADPYREIPE